MEDSFLAPLMFRFENRSRFCSGDEIVESVRQNIECLLNSRLSIPPDYLLRTTDQESIDCLNDSLVNFGVVDFQSLNMGDPLMEKRFCKSVQLSIHRFEPRLENVSVVMSPSVSSRLINTEVTGQLVVQPFEAIKFDSSLDPVNQSFVVS
jgi:type VI secretion system protein ImpF